MELYSSHTSFASFQHPCPFPGVILRRRYPFSCSKRETRPTRASVSSCWIGNQAQAVWSFEKPPDVATSLIDPWYPGGRGAVSPGRSLFRYLNRPQAKTSALPLLTPVYPLEGLSLGGLYPNYYMSLSIGLWPVQRKVNSDLLHKTAPRPSGSQGSMRLVATASGFSKGSRLGQIADPI